MYRDSLIPLYSPDVEIYYRLQAGQFIARKAYQEAVDILKSVPAELLEGHSIGLVAFDLSTAYEGLGDTEQQMYYLAKSAIVDLKLSIKEYIALHKLAYLLYQQGDIERAYKYLNRSMLMPFSAMLVFGQSVSPNLILLSTRLTGLNRHKSCNYVKY